MPVSLCRTKSPCVRPSTAPGGYTLVELLVTTVIALVIMAAVVSLFGSMGSGINNARSALEMTNQLRTAESRLQQDLAGITVDLALRPPVKPGDNLGYFQYTEGPIGSIVPPSNVASSTDHDVSQPDTTVGDIDDVLMFTTQSTDQPFAGRVLIKRWPTPEEWAGSSKDDCDGDGSEDDGYELIRTATSKNAEVAWFLRGTTLYRRVLLVLPDFDADLRNTSLPKQMQLDSRPQATSDGTPTYETVSAANAGAGFFRDYDISVHRASGALGPNTLGDLTNLQNRFAHSLAHGYPYHPRMVMGWGTPSGNVPPLGLPTLGECSYVYPRYSSGGLDVTNSWVAGDALPTIAGGLSISGQPFDAWRNPRPWDQVDHVNGDLSLDTGSATDPHRYQGGPVYDPTNLPHVSGRAAEDIILTNVIGFDVKIWDPGAPLMGIASGNVLLPGEPGYMQAVRDYVAGPQNTTTYPRPVGYGAFVDLNYMCTAGPDAGSPEDPNYSDALKPASISSPVFHHAGLAKSGLRGTEPSLSPSVLLPAVYDTWSEEYEKDGVDQDGDGRTDVGPDTLDNDTDGQYDEEDEWEAPPPYFLEPASAIQIKIRVFDPDSRQIREVTVVQKF